jgi:L-ascorbate metabolism protein UlaG (beta-lactamase superfamily)
MIEFEGIKIKWLGHDTFLVSNSKLICTDPFEIKKDLERKADIVLVTHNHFDHCNTSDIKKVSNKNTVLICPQICKSEVEGLNVKEIKYMSPGDKVKVDDVEVEAVPAYNVNKFRAPGKVFHPKEEGHIGYVFTVNNIRVYLMGDTDFIPEMSNIKADIVLVPVSGTYVMTAEEAIEAVNTIKPRLAIPMHFGAIVGSKSDAERFARGVSCEVKILSQEG